MPLTQEQKQQLKDDWDTMTRLAAKFAKGSVQDLYVIDRAPMLDGAEAIASLQAKLPRACWTRGKQGHG